MKSRTCVLFLLLITCLLSAPRVFPQEKTVPGAGETSARVESLDRFHEVIVPIWHDAWPNKNTAMLRTLLPEVNKGIAAIATAELPGILREKKKAWEAGVAQLKAAGDAYKTAAAGRDDQALLDAAETLHARYETLARTLRPALKELEEFHATLYTLYHYELPAGAIEKIRLSTAALKVRMEALNRAVLPARLQSKAGAFAAARVSLGASRAALDSVLSTNDDSAIRSAVVSMHGRYEALSAVCD
jgi:hypothetical protein